VILAHPLFFGVTPDQGADSIAQNVGMTGVPEFPKARLESKDVRTRTNCLRFFAG
jgi:hypothetical protein